MKKMKINILGSLMLVFLLSQLFIASANPSDPLQNGSFETGLSPWAGNGATRVTNPVQSGSYSVKLYSSGTAYVTQSVDYLVDEFDRISFYATSVSGYSTGYIKVTDSAGHVYEKSFTANDVQWKRFYFYHSEMTSSQSTDHVYTIKIYTSGTTNSAYVDNVIVYWSVKGGGGCNPYC